LHSGISLSKEELAQVRVFRQTDCKEHRSTAASSTVLESSSSWLSHWAMADHSSPGKTSIVSLGRSFSKKLQRFFPVSMQQCVTSAVWTAKGRNPTAQRPVLALAQSKRGMHAVHATVHTILSCLFSMPKVSNSFDCRLHWTDRGRDTGLTVYNVRFLSVTSTKR
jgi:hypothetical protein